MQLTKYVVATILFATLLNIISSDSREVVVHNPVIYSSDWNFTVLPTAKGCFSEKLDLWIYVEIGEIISPYEYSNLNVAGQWDPKTYTIRLESTSLETIAHEVHHMVDTVMMDRQITDHHMAAYMQGKFTECVYKIVNNE